MVETIKVGEQVLAIIIRASFKDDGVNFFTPNHFSQQLAHMKHPAGKTIDAHVHNMVKREVLFTQEVLVIKSGKLRVDLYDNDQNYQESRVLSGGDVILLASGGHGMDVIEDLEMFEIKQGPFSAESDKSRFGGVAESAVCIKGNN